MPQPDLTLQGVCLPLVMLPHCIDDLLAVVLVEVGEALQLRVQLPVQLPQLLQLRV